VSAFEYVMVLVSIVIGLAITHLLTAVAAAIHRLRGHGEPIRLEPIYLLWIGYVMIWLISFWWLEFEFQAIETEWSFGLYLFIISYSVFLFVLAAVLVPEGMERVSDSYVFFMEGRRWFFGGNLLLITIDLADGFLKGNNWGFRPAVLVKYGVFTAASVVGIMSERRVVQRWAAIASFTSELLYMFVEAGVLGSW
jgi:hypothetical protein